MSTPVVITNSKQWSGQFDCTGPCRRKRLVGAEFSKKAMERYRRNGGGPLKCKLCVAAVEATERRAAQERAEAKANTNANAQAGAEELVAAGEGGIGKAKQATTPPPAHAASASASSTTCASCKKSLPPTSYNRNQLSKPPGKARCRICVEAAVKDEATASREARLAKIEDAKRAVADAERSGDVAATLAAESRLSALEAEVVTGLKPVALGKGRGGRWRSGRSGRGRR